MNAAAAVPAGYSAQQQQQMLTVHTAAYSSSSQPPSALGRPGSSMSSSASVPNQLGSNRSAAMAMHYQTMQQLPLEKRIAPQGLPPQMLTGYEDMSMETLCTVGKELVAELMTRMITIVNVLKMNIKGENKPNRPQLSGVENVDSLRFQLEYAQHVFMALTELRLRIDLKLFQQLGPGQTLLKDARPSDQELLMLLADAKEEEKPNENPDELEEAKCRNLEAEAKFEQNRQQLVRLGCELKKLEWLSSNMDPATLLNVGEGLGSGGTKQRRSDESRRS